MTPEETQLPNGMGWDMKKQVMYLNDTFLKEFGDTPGIIWEIRVDQQGVPVRNASQQLEKRYTCHLPTTLWSAMHGQLCPWHLL